MPSSDRLILGSENKYGSDDRTAAELERLLRVRRTAVGRYQRRRADEQVNYWRQRAGWFDDDISMSEYNNGVYDTYYQFDDDARMSSGSGSIRKGGGSSANAEIVKNALKVLSVLVALALSALMFRAIMRRLGTSSKKDKKRAAQSHSGGGGSDNRSRSSRSKSRSRSRSRSRRGSSRAGDYNLMDDDDGKSARSGRSKRSTRSSSKSGKRGSHSSRSRSRPRSRSRGRGDRKKDEKPTAEPVLV